MKPEKEEVLPFSETNENCKPEKPIKSQFHQKYLSMVQPILQQHQQSHNIQQEQTSQKWSLKDQPFRLIVDADFQPNQLYGLIVYMRGIRFDLKVLLVDHNSPLSKIQPCYEGTFGNVHIVNILDVDLAIKSYELQHRLEIVQFQSSPVIQKIITEYILSQQSSKMKTGPHMENWFGFDLIFFNDRVEFIMEKCQPITQVSGNLIQFLMISIHELHKRNIVHNDITPNNIMFSPTYNKPIFIDYGFSQLQFEKIGEKTLTRFHGTANYVSKQMLALFSVEDKSDYIDLYYNDLICLQNSVDELSKKIKNNPSIQISNLLNNSLGQFQQDQGITILKDKVQAFYLYVLFRFSIYFRQKDVPGLLNYKDQLLIRKSGREILKSLIKKIPSSNYEDIIFNQLYCLRYMDEYIDLCKTVRIRDINAFSHSKIVQIMNSMVSRSYFCMQKINEFQEIVNKYSDDQKLSHQTLGHLWNHYRLSQDRILLFAVLFDELRCYSVKLDFQTKKSLADSFILLNGIENDPHDLLFSIRTTFTILLKEILCFPQNVYISKFICNLIAQALLTEADIKKELQYFLSLLKTSQLNVTIQIIYFTNLFYCVRFIDLKFSYMNIDNSKKMEKQLIQCLNMLQRDIMSYLSKSNDPEEELIFTCMTIFLNNTNYTSSQISQIIQQLGSLTDNLIRSKILKLLFFAQLQMVKVSSNCHHKTQDLYKIRSFFSINKQLTFFDLFIEQIFWRYTLAIELDNILARTLVFKYCLSFIEIPCLYEGLVPFLEIFHTASQKYSNKDQLLERTADKFLDWCFKENKVHLYKKQLSSIIYNFATRSELQNVRQNFIIKIGKQLMMLIQRQIINANEARLSRTNRDQFRLDTSYIQFGSFIVQFLLELQSDQAKQLVSQVNVMFDNLQWSILQGRADIDPISSYDSYLLFYCYNYKMIYITEPKDWIAINKLKLSLLPKLPQYCIKLLFTKIFYHIEIQTTRVQNNQSNQKQQFIDSVIQQVWNYCVAFSKLKYYYLFKTIKTNVVIMATLTMLLKHQNQYQNWAIVFLNYIATYLANNPTADNIQYFQYNVTLFYLQNKYFFNNPIPISSDKWKYRFGLLYLAFHLNQETNPQKAYKLFIKISRSLFLHSWVSRMLILFLYFKNVVRLLNLFANSIRKVKYIFKKYMPALDSQYGQFLGFSKDKYVSDLFRMFRLEKKKKKYLQTIAEKQVRGLQEQFQF